MLFWVRKFPPWTKRDHKYETFLFFRSLKFSFFLVIPENLFSFATNTPGVLIYLKNGAFFSPVFFDSYFFPPAKQLYPGTYMCSIWKKILKEEKDSQRE